MVNNPAFGDESLWHLAIQDYYPKIVNYVYYLSGDRFLAEDIAQETFARGIEKFYQLKDPNKFFPWLLSIAINLGRNHFKNRYRMVPTLNVESYPSFLSNNEFSLEIIERQETQKFVQDAINNLPLQEQHVVIMRYYLDMKEKDIAFVLGVTVGTVKKQLFRARSKLYQDLHQLSGREGD